MLFVRFLWAMMRNHDNANDKANCKVWLKNYSRLQIEMKIFPFEHLDGMSILANNDNACFFILVFTINNLFRLLSLTGLITLERFPPGGRI